MPRTQVGAGQPGVDPGPGYRGLQAHSHGRSPGHHQDGPAGPSAGPDVPSQPTGRVRRKDESRSGRPAGGGMVAGDNTVERTAALALTATVGTSFGPGLLPRPGLDQALATGIVAATNHGLVMTSQSASAALAHRFVADDGTPAGRVRSFAAQAAVSAGVAVGGAGLGGCCRRGRASRCAGRRCGPAGLPGVGGRAGRHGDAGVAAADAAVGGRRPGLRVLAAGGGLLAGTASRGGRSTGTTPARRPRRPGSRPPPTR